MSTADVSTAIRTQVAIRHDLRAVTCEIRPDWDLATPRSARGVGCW